MTTENEIVLFFSVAVIVRVYDVVVTLPMVVVLVVRVGVILAGFGGRYPSS